jgi:PTH2 family peptidyl-tRNA hydrolase
VSHKYKQAIILRTNIKMGTGKKVAQGCHASVIAMQIVQKSNPMRARDWTREGQMKIVLKVQTEEDLIAIYNHAKARKLPCSIIQDAGHTQLAPGTTTAVGIGPALAGEIDKVTHHLKLL